MKYVTTNKRQKTLAVITAAVLGGVLIFITIIDPQLKRGTALNSQMHQLQTRLTKVRSDMLIKDRIDRMYSEIEPLISSTRTDQQEISLLTRQLNDLYSKLPVKIRSVKILPMTETEFYRKVSLKIEMSGKIRDVMKFVFSVERSAEPVRIERFNLKAKEAADHVQASFLISKLTTQQVSAEVHQRGTN